MKVSALTSSILLVAALCLYACGGGGSSAQPGTFSYHKKGKASYYADKFDGEQTANGETFDQTKLTAAHKKLPFGTHVRVTNLENKKSVVVRINDRFDNHKGRIIDLSKAAFAQLAPLELGVIKVEVETLDD